MRDGAAMHLLSTLAAYDASGIVHLLAHPTKGHIVALGYDLGAWDDDLAPRQITLAPYTANDEEWRPRRRRLVHLEDD